MLIGYIAAVRTRISPLLTPSPLDVRFGDKRVELQQ